MKTIKKPCQLRRTRYVVGQVVTDDIAKQLPRDCTTDAVANKTSKTKGVEK